VILDGHYLVECTKDIPAHIFDSSSTGIDPHTLAVTLYGTLTLGLPPPDQGDLGLQLGPESGSTLNQINSITSYYGAIIDTVQREARLTRLVQPASFWLRTVAVHLPSYRWYEFKLSREQIKDLFLYGYEFSKTFFEN